MTKNYCARSEAEGDAVDHSHGFLLRTGEGDIHIPANKARLVDSGARTHVECDVPLMVDETATWIVFTFAGGEDIYTEEVPVTRASI